MTVVLDMDATDPSFNQHRAQPYLMDWLRRHSIDPGACLRVEVLADGDGYLRVHEYDMPKRLIPGTTNVAMRPPYMIPLTASIPPELMAKAGS